MLFQGTASAMVGPSPGNATLYGCVELIGDYEERRLRLVDIECPPGFETWTPRGEIVSVVEMVEERGEDH